MSDEILRRFARDQWVRVHGTPRVTVLVGASHARRMWQQWLEVGDLRGELYEGSLDAAARDAAARATAEPRTPVALLTEPGALAAWRRGRNDRLAAMIDESVVEVAERPAAAAMPPVAAEPSVPPVAVTATATAATATAAATAAAATAAAAVAAPAVAAPAVVAPAVAAPAAELAGAPALATPTRAATANGAGLFDARSAAEVAMFEALEATPATAGRFELNGYLSVHFGGGAAEVDLLARRERIAIEIDGYHHFTDLDRYRRDRKKDLLLQLQGLIVIRLHAQDVVRDPRAAVTTVCQALAYRMERQP